MTIRFSIITVTLNNLSGLKKTYKSIDSQSFRDFEWLVMDGDSEDGTVEYLQTHELNFTSKPDGGIYDAMNKGIERAGGDYIIFLNAGDCLAGDRVLETLAGVEAGFIYGDAVESGHYKKARSHTKIDQGLFTHHQAMIYSRCALGGLRYDTGYKVAADYDFTTKFLRGLQESDIVYIPKPLCIYEAGGMSQNNAALGRKEQFRIRKTLGIPLWKNSLIYGLQFLNHQLRLCFPAFYWLLKANRS